MAENSLKKHIVFVCTGNMCRSPMAEGIFKYLSQSRSELICESAGVAAYQGFPASVNAILVAKKYGIDLSYHLSRCVTSSLVEKADYVFVMTTQHLNILNEHFPEHSKKIFLLKDFSGVEDDTFNLNVEDPIGGDLEDYEKCFLELEKLIKGVLEKL
ncbi:low molecular weight protein arginine phosphatase [bacterium]|nr:low molecular weight protein arginine phosphatase [bacterium]